MHRESGGCSRDMRFVADGLVLASFPTLSDSRGSSGGVHQNGRDSGG